MLLAALKLFGLPAHPLLVHVPVVMVPLAALGAIAIVVRPRWRRSAGPIVLALAFVGGLGTQLAMMSGEDLQGAVRTFLEKGGPGHAEFHGR